MQTVTFYPVSVQDVADKDAVMHGILAVVQARTDARTALSLGKSELEVDLHCARAARLEGALLLAASRCWSGEVFEDFREVVERFHAELH